MSGKRGDLLPIKPSSSDKTIEAVVPADADQYMHDAVVTGLVLRVTPAGRKIWHLRYQSPMGKGGKNIGRKFSFGDFTEGMKTREAREIAEDWRVRIRQGDDPLEERKRLGEIRREEADKAAAKLKEEKTLNDVARAYEIKLGNPVSGHKDGGAGAMSILQNHLLSNFGDMPIKQFRREHLFEAVDLALARGHNRMANAVLTNTKTLFRFAAKRGYLEYSPIDVLVKADVGGNDKIRERVLCETQFKKDELHELFLIVPESDLLLHHQIAIRILLGTACRVGELFKARWCHIDFDARRWIIPGENSKNTDPIAIHLSDFVLEELRKLRELSGHSEFLFPGRSQQRSYMCPKTISRLVGERQRGPDAPPQKGRSNNHSDLILPGGRWTIHDLRRTASTQMQMLGVAPHVIDACQNHRTGGSVRRRYQHGSYYDAMRIAWDLLGRSLASLAGASAGAKLMASIEHVPEQSNDNTFELAFSLS